MDCKELVQDNAPVPDGHGPFLGGLPCCPIYGFHHRVVGREGKLVLGVLPDLPVQVLYKVGGIDDLSYLEGELIKHGEFVPVVPPAFYGIGVFALPFFGEVLQGSLCGLLVGGIVDALHVGGERLIVLPYHVAAGISYLVHHAYLCPGFREDVPDGVGEPVQVFSGGDQDILGATGLHNGEHRHPEGRRFVLARPEAEHLLFAVPAQAHGHIDGLVDYLGGFPDLEDDRVHPYDWVNGLQGTVLPGDNVVRHLFGGP